MTTPTTLALHRLLPSLSPLPTLLTSTADSLLALSRQRASHLPGNEEIARAHACAEIACTRLRGRLRLPPIKAGTAPANAKVYGKLVGFLEVVLGDVGVKVRTPAKKGEGNAALTGTPGKRKRVEEGGEGTPSKRSKVNPSVAMAGTGTRTPKGFAGKVKARTKASAGADEAPPFVMPAIRKLCHAFSTPEMTPHVYTATCIVLKLSGLYPRPTLEEASQEDLEVTDEMWEGDVMSLVVAMYLMVLTRMMRGKMTSGLFRGVQGKAGEVLGAVGGKSGVGAWKGKEVQGWVKRVNKEGWAKGQGWWGSVPEGVFEFGIERVEGVLTGKEIEAVDVGVEGEEDGEGEARVRREELNLEADPEDVLLSGLGTMMQDAVDWISQDRKDDLQDWKLEMLERLERLDQPPGANGTVEVH